MNIKTKLMLGLVSATLIPVVIVSLVVVSNLRTQAVDTFLERSQGEMTQVDNTISIYFDGIEKNVRMLASHPAFAKSDGSISTYVASQGEAMTPDDNSMVEKAIYRALSLVGESHSDYSYVYMGTQKGGYIQWPKGNISANYDPRQRPWFKTAMAAPDQVGRTPAYYWSGDDATIVGTVLTFEADKRENSGVVAVDVSLKNLTDIVKGIKLGDSGFLIMVEDNGNILVDAKHPENNFKSIRSLGQAYQSLDQTSQGLVEVDIDGIAYMANVMASDRLGWKFIGLISRDEVMASSNRLVSFIVVIAAVLGGVFVMGAAILANLIAKPLALVSHGLKEIAEGEGDLTKELTITSKDETGQLASYFNEFLKAIRQLIQQIGSAGAAMRESAQRAGTVSSDLVSVSDRQNEAVTMVSTAFNQMVATANEVANLCTTAAQAAEQSQELVSQGQGDINLSVQSVNQLANVMESTVESIRELEQDSQAITAILDTIRGIAEQTNLLALNAAIEAARAGEQGRGFAVVADEVRALAKRTQDSTAEIDELVQQLQSRTKEVSAQVSVSLEASQQTVDTTASVNNSFTGISESVTAIHDMSSQIATAAEEQHLVAEEINRNIQQVHDDTQRVDDVAKRAQLNSEQLGEAAQQLSELVSKFKT